MTDHLRIDKRRCKQRQDLPLLNPYNPKAGSGCNPSTARRDDLSDLSSNSKVSAADQQNNEDEFHSEPALFDQMKVQRVNVDNLAAQHRNSSKKIAAQRSRDIAKKQSLFGRQMTMQNSSARRAPELSITNVDEYSMQQQRQDSEIHKGKENRPKKAKPMRVRSEVFDSFRDVMSAKTPQLETNGSMNVTLGAESKNSSVLVKAGVEQVHG